MGLMPQTISAGVCVPDTRTELEVVGVAYNDTLNVRTGWTTKQPVLFELLPTEASIEFLDVVYKSAQCEQLCNAYQNGAAQLFSQISSSCRNRSLIWYRIQRQNGMEGWASAKFLAEYPKPVVRVVPQPIETPSTSVTALAQSQQSVVVVATDSVSRIEAQKVLDELSAQVAALRGLLDQQQAKLLEDGETQVRELATRALERKLSELTEQLEQQTTETSSNYRTPVRPSTDYSTISPRELARHFPSIPWYNPSYSNEIGEFSLEARVSDEGSLLYDLKFIEPQHASQNIADQFSLVPEDAETILAALQKAYDWKQTAEENGIRNSFRKTVDCTPAAQCESRVQGNTSTQVDFVIFEQGATGVRLIRNKGAYPSEFGMSIESAALLAAYFDFVLEMGQSGFNAGTRTAEEVDALFD